MVNVAFCTFVICGILFTKHGRKKKEGMKMKGGVLVALTWSQKLGRTLHWQCLGIKKRKEKEKLFGN